MQCIHKGLLILFEANNEQNTYHNVEYMLNYRDLVFKDGRELQDKKNYSSDAIIIVGLLSTKRVLSSCECGVISSRYGSMDVEIGLMDAIA